MMETKSSFTSASTSANKCITSYYGRFDKQNNQDQINKMLFNDENDKENVHVNTNCATQAYPNSDKKMSATSNKKTRTISALQVLSNNESHASHPRSVFKSKCNQQDKQNEQDDTTSMTTDDASATKFYSDDQTASLKRLCTTANQTEQMLTKALEELKSTIKNPNNEISVENFFAKDRRKYTMDIIKEIRCTQTDKIIFTSRNLEEYMDKMKDKQHLIEKAEKETELLDESLVTDFSPLYKDENKMLIYLNRIGKLCKTKKDELTAIIKEMTNKNKSANNIPEGQEMLQKEMRDSYNSEIKKYTEAFSTIKKNLYGIADTFWKKIGKEIYGAEVFAQMIKKHSSTNQCDALNVNATEGEAIINSEVTPDVQHNTAELNSANLQELNETHEKGSKALSPRDSDDISVDSDGNIITENFKDTECERGKRGDIEKYMQDICENVSFSDDCDGNALVNLQMTQSNPMMLALDINTAVPVVHITTIIGGCSMNLIYEQLYPIRLCGLRGKFKNLRSLTFLVPTEYSSAAKINIFKQLVLKYLPLSSDKPEARWTAKLLEFVYAGGKNDVRQLIVFRLCEKNQIEHPEKLSDDMYTKVKAAMKRNKSTFGALHLPEGCHAMSSNTINLLLTLLDVQPADTFWEIGAGECKLAYALSAAAEGGIAVVTELESLYSLWMIFVQQWQRNSTQMPKNLLKRSRVQNSDSSPFPLSQENSPLIDSRSQVSKRNRLTIKDDDDEV